MDLPSSIGMQDRFGRQGQVWCSRFPKKGAWSWEGDVEVMEGFISRSTSIDPHRVAHRVAVVSFPSHRRAHSQAPDPQAHRATHPPSTLRVLLAGLGTCTHIKQCLFFHLHIQRKVTSQLLASRPVRWTGGAG